MITSARAAILSCLAVAGGFPALAASADYNVSLAFLNERFLGVFVDDESGPLLLGEDVGGAENVYGLKGRFSDLGPGEVVHLVLGFDPADMAGPDSVRVLNCSFAGLDCVDGIFPYAAMPGSDGSFALGRADGPDLLISGNLMPGGSVSFTELDAGFSGGPLAEGYSGFFTDYRAAFTVTASSLAPEAAEPLPAVPLPASAALLPVPVLLLWPLRRRRRR